MAELLPVLCVYVFIDSHVNRRKCRSLLDTERHEPEEAICVVYSMPSEEFCKTHHYDVADQWDDSGRKVSYKEFLSKKGEDCKDDNGSVLSERFGTSNQLHIFLQKPTVVLLGISRQRLVQFEIYIRKVCSRLTTGQLNGYPGYSRNMQRFG